MAKTSENSLSHSLFPDEQIANLFPLIELKLHSNVYLHALLPKDQIFEEDDEEEAQRESKELSKKSFKTMDNSDNVNEESKVSKPQNNSENINTDNEVLDNPYLRQPKSFSSVVS